jgi:chemotaxis protein methyltransferase CheR
MLTSHQFERARALALRLAGIELVDRHRDLLARRWSRLEIEEQTGFDALLSLAEAGDPTAIRQVLRLFTTNVTAFFRHAVHFDIAAQHALLAASRRGNVRCWSAAASTGEEPYSLAIALAGIFTTQVPPCRILATDIDEVALEVARRAEYGEADLGELEAEVLARGFRQTASGLWTLKADIRRLVQFSRLNLIDVTWHNVDGPFDIIFCRNVLMYLEASHRYSVAERMASLLAPDGLLFLDPAEYLGKAGHFFSPTARGAYSLRRTSRQSHNP